MVYASGFTPRSTCAHVTGTAIGNPGRARDDHAPDRGRAAAVAQVIDEQPPRAIPFSSIGPGRFGFISGWGTVVDSARLRSMRRGAGTLAIAGSLAILLLTDAGAASAKRSQPSHPLSIDQVNGAQLLDARRRGPSPDVLKAEILLDRGGFSPGAIDGKAGDNFKKALAAFQRQSGLAASGHLDADTWARLTADSDAVLMDYTIADADVKGPFTPKIPRRLEDMARLKTLSYTSPVQLLAERFHMAPGLLEALNPKARFEQTGTDIVVANVARAPPQQKATKVEVDKGGRDVRVLGEDGALLAFYPASIGSEERPAPSGKLTVHAIAKHPVYHYDPKLAFKGVKARRRFKIVAGPNNPVGDVWIDLSDSYGIHGTPDPEKVGKTYSHGCIRLTNWDAMALAQMVRKGTEVDFLD